jgi:integrase
LPPENGQFGDKREFMATVRQRGPKAFEVIIKRSRMLPKPISFTFDTESEAISYGARVEVLLDQGIIPDGLISKGKQYRVIADVMRAYRSEVAVPESDQKNLDRAVRRIGVVPLHQVGYEWSEKWVKAMKREQALSPSTIRHYVGALARGFDWAMRKGIPELAVNPLRALPKRYATYNEDDARALAVKGLPAPVDTSRDRRLEKGEEDAIRAALAGEKRPDRERPLELRHQAALECLFTLALESAMRLREMYTLTMNQVDFPLKTVFLDKTKNGHKRQVPLTSVAIKALKVYLQHVKDGTRGMEGFTGAGGRLFPWWNGEKSHLEPTTALLSVQFGRIFAYAGMPDFNFHDLRHEATSRFFERTELRESEIMAITGHLSQRSVARYRNLRGSDLAERLW